jgi:hypothetical protein
MNNQDEQDRIAKLLKKSLSFDELQKTKAFEYLKEYIVKEIEDTFDLVGTKSVENEHDLLVRVRAYNEVLNHIAVQASGKERLTKRYKDIFKLAGDHSLADDPRLA